MFLKFCDCMLAPISFQVHAEHEEKSDNGDVRRRFYVRRYRLPKAVDVDRIRSSLSKDGVLSIEAPTPGLAPTERLVPVQYQQGDEQNQAGGEAQ
jgi:HSP20 family molecular chaperone IbpA